MKVSIVGYGFVGKALFNAFTDQVDVQKIDPILNTSIDEIKDFMPDIIFICVPTPMNQNGTQDISILIEIIETISSFNLSSLIVIKSTILPSYVSQIENMLEKFVYNPEFLREKYANEDFINSKMIIFGGRKSSAEELSNFYNDFLNCKCKDFIITDPTSASFIKYMINSFLATKVIFFNEFNNLFKSSNAKEDWTRLTEIIARDERLGSSHMDVPGHDGRYGFGGACLPKDSKAIIKYADDMKVNLKILKTVIKVNNKIRSSYNDNTPREDEQNIIFED
tara:strand:- start:2474 stop:3313 length:840 start_codon:yes stop_codon:yes gene_type:complete